MFSRNDVLFFAYALLGLPANFSGSMSLYARIVIYPWLIAFVFQNVRPGSGYVRLLVYAVIGVSAAVAGIIFFQVGPGEFLLSPELLLRERGRGFYYRDELVGPTTIAAVLVVPILAAVALVRQGRGSPLFNSLTMLAGTLLLAVSASRTSFVAVVGGAAVLFYATAGTRSLMRRFAAAAARIVLMVSALVAVVVGLLPELPETYRLRLIAITRLTSDTSLVVRLQLWSDAIGHVASDPQGLGFSFFLGRYGLTAHNESL